MSGWATEMSIIIQAVWVTDTKEDGMTTTDLMKYFTEGVATDTATLSTYGMEVETMFVTADGEPISTETSQRIFGLLAQTSRWKVAEMRGALTTKLVNAEGDSLAYELGRHNIELSSRPIRDRAARAGFVGDSALLAAVRKMLGELYKVAKECEAFPRFEPVMPPSGNLLVIPDERDTTWLKLDGVDALNLLARTSAVQFTIPVTVESAISALNRLGASFTREFLPDYPQDVLWRRYIAESRAKYHVLRYGGPLQFLDLADYCARLAEHDIVTPAGLVPFASLDGADITMFLRSVWWYFRLRRYGATLCIECRPLPRRDDALFDEQFQRMLSAFYGVPFQAPLPKGARCAAFFMSGGNCIGGDSAH